jgi:hypothetical protein
MQGTQLRDSRFYDRADVLLSHNENRFNFCQKVDIFKPDPEALSKFGVVVYED